MYTRKILGIIGGMGSHAAVSLFQEVIRKCPATDDQEYIEVILHNNTRIPDRTKAILHGEEDVLPELLRSVRMLKEQGASYIVMACVTAHYYIDQLREMEPEIPVINLFEITVNYIRQHFPGISSIGVLGSTGLMASGLWPAYFRDMNVAVLTLGEEDQEQLVMQAIYGKGGLKDGYVEGPEKLLLGAVDKLRAQGAGMILSSCSELPMVLGGKKFDIPFVECFDKLTDHIIDLFYADSAAPAVIPVYHL